MTLSVDGQQLMHKQRLSGEKMTREEAITRIKDHIEIHRYHERNAVKIFEALDMAIKSLEQPEIIRCKDCKHRPTATRADEEVFYGFSVEFPDEKCPCYCEDGWYGWYPEDDFYCGYAERQEE